MAKIIVFNNDTDKMETYYKEESDAMPYNTNNSLKVNEFRGSSKSNILWTTKRTMQAWNSQRYIYGSPIYVGFAFKRPYERRSRKSEPALCYSVVPLLKVLKKLHLTKLMLHGSIIVETTDTTMLFISRKGYHMLEKKEMSKKNWKRLIEGTYVYEYLKDYDAIVSVLYLKKLISPSCKQYSNKNVKIADDGYYWLQFAVNNKNWWLTAMYDESKKLVQYYIDITQKNVVNQDGTAYFYDLFLDIVILSNNEIIILDEDELAEALKLKEINKEQFDNAYTEKEKILEDLKHRQHDLDSFCQRKLNNLLSKF